METERKMDPKNGKILESIVYYIDFIQSEFVFGSMKIEFQSHQVFPFCNPIPIKNM